MKNKVSILVFIIVAAAAVYFFTQEDKGTLSKELSNFAVADTASITKIFLADQNGKTVELDRKSSTYWTLNNTHRARQDGVNNLLDVIKRVTVKTPINKSAFETIIKRLATSGTKVEIYTNNETTPSKIYYVGGANQEHSATEMLMEGSSVPFYTHMEGFYGFLTPRYFTNPNEWKDRTVFRYGYGEIASIKIEHPLYEEQSFEITDLGNNTFSLKSLAQGALLEQFDTTKLLDFVTRFKNVQYESFEETKTPEYIAAIQETTPEQIITITSKTGEVTKCVAYLKPAHEGATDYEGNPIDFDLDRMYAKVNDTDFVVVQHFVFDKLNKRLDYFLE